MINYEDHLKLVCKIANKYANSKEQFKDYRQEGIIALLTAIKNFDESKEFKFSTYAYKYIEGYILLYINRKDRVINVKNASGRSDISVTFLENVTTSEVDNEEYEYKNFLLIDQDMLEKTENIEERIENIKKVKIFLSILPKRNRILLYKKFCEEKSYREIAKEENITAQRIQQLIDSSLKKIRKVFKIKLGKGS